MMLSHKPADACQRNELAMPDTDAVRPPKRGLPCIVRIRERPRHMHQEISLEQNTGPSFRVSGGSGNETRSLVQVYTHHNENIFPKNIILSLINDIL